MYRAKLSEGLGRTLESCRALQHENKNAALAELADALDLGSSGRPCRFDSCMPHHFFYKARMVELVDAVDSKSSG